MVPSFESQRLRALALTCLILTAFGTSAPVGQTPPIDPSLVQCGSCQNTSLVAYNRYVGFSIGANTPCGAQPVGIYPLDAANKKVSYRFTLSSTFVGSQSVSGVWLYYQKRNNAPQYTVSVRADDSTGRPGVVLAQSTFTPQASVPPGSPVWHSVPLAATGLTPGSIYHVVLEAAGTPDATNCLEAIAARSRIPVAYMPTDGLGAAIQSPCDRFLSVMTSPGSTTVTDFLSEENGVGAITPIFVLDLGSSGLFGQPYNVHSWSTIANVGGQDRHYGQAVVLPQQTQVNYVSFWVHNLGCVGDPGVGHALEFKLRSALNPATVIASATIPTPQPFYGRAHWFGVFFTPVVLQPGTYYLALSSPLSSGTGTDGWSFEIENSTLPRPASTLPTYLRDASFAVESLDGGASFHPISRKADAGFLLGNFPAGPTGIGGICDSGASVFCVNSQTWIYPRTANPGDTIGFGPSNRNIGSIGADPTARQYIRLLDSDCNPLTPEVLCADTQQNKDGAQPPLYWTWPSTLFGDQFLWLEFGHQSPFVHALIRDEIVPYEIRVGSCP